jgi:hypothetical protein
LFQLNLNGAVGQLVWFERPGNGLLDGTVFVGAKAITAIHHNMSRQDVMFTIQRPEVLMMNLTDTIDAKQRATDLFMERFVWHSLKKQLPGHPEITHHIE